MSAKLPISFEIHNNVPNIIGEKYSKTAVPLQVMEYTDAELLIKIGAKVVARRKELNLTQEDLAYSANIDRTYIGYVENGKQNITISMLNKLAKALKIDITDFFND